MNLPMSNASPRITRMSQAVATGGHLFCASPAQPTGFERWAIEPSFNRRPDVIYTRDLDLGKGDTAWIAF